MMLLSNTTQFNHMTELLNFLLCHAQIQIMLSPQNKYHILKGSLRATRKLPFSLYHHGRRPRPLGKLALHFPLSPDIVSGQRQALSNLDSLLFHHSLSCVTPAQPQLLRIIFFSWILDRRPLSAISSFRSETREFSPSVGPLCNPQPIQLYSFSKIVTQVLAYQMVNNIKKQQQKDLKPGEFFLEWVGSLLVSKRNFLQFSLQPLLATLLNADERDRLRPRSITAIGSRSAH